jgi:tetratricopeptide (TPR) repeat protein
MKKPCALSRSKAMARTRLGICYVSLGRVETGIQEFKEALRIDKRCGLAHYWLSKTYATTLKNKGQALVHYKKLAALDATLANDLAIILN